MIDTKTEKLRTKKQKISDIWFQSSKDTDVSLLFGKEVRKVKEFLLLEQCALFANMNKSPVISGPEKEYPIPEDWPVNIFQGFQTLLYTNEFPSDQNLKDEKQRLYWAQVGAFCDYCLFEKGSQLIQESWRKFVFSEDPIELATMMKEYFALKTVWESIWELTSERLCAEFEEALNEKLAPSEELIGCYDTLKAGEGPREIIHRNYTCCAHSLIFAMRESTEEDKKANLTKGIQKHDISSALRVDLRGCCWNHSFEQKRVATIGEAIQAIGTRLCCIHAQPEDAPFRQTIVQFNLKKVASKRFLDACSNAPQELQLALFQNLCKSNLPK